MKDNQDYINLIASECKKAKIDPDLFCAIVNTESAWDPSVSRYEKGYPYLYNPARYAAIENISIETETVLQQISYGLCQIMGSSARICGYMKPLMTLLDPLNNIQIGVKFFKKNCDIHPEIKDKISSYNAGSPVMKDNHYLNQDYVDKVFRYFSQLKNR